MYVQYNYIIIIIINMTPQLYLALLNGYCGKQSPD